MTQWTASAIVLFAEPQGESDLRVQMLTPRQGRITAMAKGALKSQKRFAGLFDTAQLLEIGLMTTPRTSRVMIEHAALREQFPRLRQNPLRLARASLLLELAILAAPENQAAPGLFSLLQLGLGKLHAEPDNDRWAVAYAFRMLAELGYQPALDCCVRCLRLAGWPEMLFHPAAGGLLCGPCCEHEAAGDGRAVSRDQIAISMDTARTVTEIMKSPENRLPRIMFTRNALAQARDILEAFIAHHLFRPSRSLLFIRRFEDFLCSAPPGN